MIKTILDYAGSGDGATDNATALTNNSTDLNGSGIVRFPHDSQNTYLFATSITASISQGLTFDVEPGCVLSVPDNGYFDASVKFVRDTLCYFRNLKEYYWFGPTTNNTDISRTIWPSYADKDDSVLLPVSPASDIIYRSVAYGSDAFSPFTPYATSISGVQINTSNINNYLVACKKITPGQELSTQFMNASGGATPIAMVRTASSYYGVAVDTADFAQPQLFHKAIGGAFTVSPLSYIGMTTHASYSAYKSVWTIRINSVKNFSILFNGYEIAQVPTDDEIVEAAYGTQGPASGSMLIQDWTLATGRKQAGKKSINIAVFGDSITDKVFGGNWPSQLITMLDECYGLRVLHMDNYAHSGDNSAAQRALCTAANIARADIVLIDIGVNDTQGGVDQNTYSTNFAAMITTCQQNGKPVVAATPTMFYGQGQAGSGVGQATTNYDQGKGMRAKCMRVCADMGVKHIDLPALIGPVMAEWRNSSLSDIATLGRNTMVYDSIHPTQLGRMVIAKAFADAIMGLIAPLPSLVARGVSLPTANAANGWLFTSEPGNWSRDPSGKVQFSGFMKAGSYIANGMVIYTMPENLRPVGATYRGVAWCDNGFCGILVDAATGNVQVFNVPSGAGWVSLSDISYQTKI